MNQNNLKNQNNSQSQFQNNNGIQYNSPDQIPIGQVGQQYQQMSQMQNSQQQKFQQQYSQQSSQQQYRQQSSQQQNFQQQYSQQGTQMLQDSGVQPRPISAQEVMNSQRSSMTQEELQKTQVLNLEDVQKIARFEKITSKKPAIVVAVIGIFFLMFGASFKIYDSLKSKEPKIQKRTIQENKKENVLAKEELKCSKIVLNNPDATDTVYNILYDFKDDKLVGFTKVFTINAIAGNPLANQTMQSYNVGYQSLLNQLDGYSVTVIPTQDLTQITATVKVDLLKLDLTKLPQIQQGHFSTKVEYVVGTERSIIENDMKAQAFTCE